MKILLSLTTLFLLASCQPKTVESDIASGAINAGAPYIWANSSFPRDLQISNSFSNAEVTNIRAMSAAWETAVEGKKDFFTDTNRTPEVSAGGMNLDALGDDGINAVYKIIHWPMDLSAGALAVTQLFGRRFNIGSSSEYVRIEHGDILINEHIYDFRTDDSGAGNTYDLRTVILHEMGHYLGLQHKYGNTVMVPSVGTTTVNRAPTSIDAVDVASKYSIALSTGSGSQMVMGANARKTYAPIDGDRGQQVKIMIELMADGECVHKENGAVVRRHSVDISNYK